MQSVLALDAREDDGRPPAAVQPPDRRYKCSFCARAFSRSEHKNRHERSHTKERPFKCDRCRSTFVRRDLLLRHVRTVHALKPSENGADHSHHDAEPDADPEPEQEQDQAIEPSNDSVVSAGSNNDAVYLEQHQQQHQQPLQQQQIDSYKTNGTSLHDTLNSNMHEDTPEISAAMLMTRLAHPPQWGEQPREQLPPPPPAAVAPAPAPPVEGDLHLLLRETLLSLDPSGAVLADTLLPTHNDLAGHISTYFCIHHPFHPFIHLPTFVPHNTPRPLLLAIVSLGALPSAKEIASRLHVASKMMVNSRIDTDGFSSRSAPLWVSQTVLLNTAFAAWSGDPRGLEFACSVKSFLANLAAGLRFELFRRSPKPPITNSASEDDEWIKLEAMRRTYFAIYAFFAQLTAVFNFPPSIPNSEPANVTLPCDEEVWNGTTAVPSTPVSTFRAGLDHVLNGQPLRCSPFASRVLASAMFIECWAATSAGLLFTPRLDQLDSLLSSYIRVVRTDSTGCLLRAAEATWKLARMRIVGVDLSLVAESLRYHDVGELVHILRGISSQFSRLPRTHPAISTAAAPDRLALAAEISCSVLFTDSAQAPQGAGGIDDIVVEWECALFLMIWVRRLEHDMGVTQHSTGLYSRAPPERELEVLQHIRSFQAEDRRRYPREKVDPDERLSVFVGSWWSRHGAANVLGGWGIRSILREAVGSYADLIRAEFSG
ncbi:fungal-specific transcription factor domain-containing protein [Myxozyma melibiosi]|uniref:Fungal-specific transcription factor domain-containing protein n=1 Tax=Myxozyma melibiosi TaxID=54550 RepID=A0ABR1EY06_9ASCO